MIEYRELTLLAGCLCFPVARFQKLTAAGITAL